VKQFSNSGDKGLVADTGLRAGVIAFLESHSAAATSVERNEATAEATLLARGDILVHIIRLSHH